MGLPACADPFFLKVFGRTYKLDSRHPSAQSSGPKLQDILKALPSDLAKGPGYRPSHQQVLVEVEELAWIARYQLEDELTETAASRNSQNTLSELKAFKEEITGSLAAGAPLSRSPDLLRMYDRHNALNLLRAELRRSMDMPKMVAGAEFSQPNLPREIEASYRDLNFDPSAAYHGFRRVKAAYRSGDVDLLSRVVHYPLTVTGKVRRTIRNAEQLAASKEKVMAPHIREVVADATFESIFVRDKGMVLGAGEVWITYDKSGVGLGAIHLE